MHSYLCSDWARLTGAPVEVWREGQLFREGTIDAATKDSRIVWLAQDGSRERVLINKADGYEIWLRPRQLQNNWTNSKDRETVEYSNAEGQEL